MDEEKRYTQAQVNHHLFRLHVTYPNVCAKHKWRGDGECPSCAGERAANESFDRLKPPVRTGERAWG